MNMNQDVLDGKVKRICGRSRERRGVRSRDFRETALGKLENTVGILQERRGRIVERLELARSRLDAPAVGMA